MAEWYFAVIRISLKNFLNLDFFFIRLVYWVGLILQSRISTWHHFRLLLKIRATSHKLPTLKISTLSGHGSEGFAAWFFAGAEGGLSQPLLSFHKALTHSRNNNLWPLLIPFHLKIIFDMNGEETFVESCSDWLAVRVLLLQQFEWWWYKHLL